VKAGFTRVVQEGVSVEDFPLTRFFLAIMCRTIEEIEGKKHKPQGILYLLRHPQFADSKTNRTPTTNSSASLSSRAVSVSELQC